MLDSTSDAKAAGYTHADDNSRMLWRSQINKANPWEHRGREADDEDEPVGTGPGARAGETRPPTMIEQADQLRLHQEEAVENPFESLLKHRLHIELPGHE